MKNGTPKRVTRLWSTGGTKTAGKVRLQKIGSIPATARMRLSSRRQRIDPNGASGRLAARAGRFLGGKAIPAVIPERTGFAPDDRRRQRWRTWRRSSDGYVNSDGNMRHGFPPKQLPPQSAKQYARKARNRGIHEDDEKYIAIVTNETAEEIKHRRQNFRSVRVHMPHVLMTCATGSLPSANTARRRSYSPNDGSSTCALRAYAR